MVTECVPKATQDLPSLPFPHNPLGPLVARRPQQFITKCHVWPRLYYLATSTSSSRATKALTIRVYWKLSRAWG
jgi:hypothetical protein